MAEVGSAFVSILPSARGFGSKLNSEIGGDLDGAGKSAGSRFGNAMKVGALAVIGAGILAGKFLKGTLDEAREAQVVTARTENVIKKMGNAAGISAGQVARLAGSISAKTGIDDEAIQAGQNLLLTFGNIRNEAGKGNDIFNQTSQLMVDMSAAMGTDAKGSAIQLGKALNDPIKGLTALSRVGVSFTEQQKAQIEKMVESGNTLGAQKVILGELERQFGGAAEAMATPADKARTAYANLKEQIGTALLPVVDKVLNAFVSAVPAISSAISGIGPAFARIKAFVAPVVAAIGSMFSGGAGGSAVASVRSFAQSISATILPALQQLGTVFTGQVLPAFVAFAQTVAANILPVIQKMAAVFTGTILPAIISVAQVIVANVIPVAQTMAATFTGTILPAITSLASYLIDRLVPIFQQVVAIITGQVIPIGASLAQFFYGTLYPAIFNVVVAVGQKLKPVFDQLVATFQGSVLPAIQKLLVKFREWQPTIQKVIGVVVQIIGKVLEFAAAILGKVLPPAIKFAGFLLGKLVPAVAGVIGIVVKVIAKIIEFGSAVVDRVQDVAQFVKGLKDKFGDALDYVQGIPGKIKNALTGIGTTLLTAGIDLIRGLIEGIKRMAGQALDAAKSVVKGAVDGVKSFLGIHSPSTVFAEIGENSMLGYKKGVEDNADKVRDAVMAAMKKSLDAMTEHRDKIKSVVDQIKSDMASLAGSVSSAFTGNLFEATTGADFVSNLTVVKGSLKKLSAAFKKLVKWGLPAKFLSQLFSSGNGALILDLASGSKSTAFDAFQTFGQVQNLAGSLGGAVARNQYGDELRRQTNRLDQINKDIKRIGDDVAHALNKTAAHAQRSAT